MSDELCVKVVRDYSGVDEIRDIWNSWQWHPNSDPDFYLTILRSRPGMLRPHVLVLYKNDRPDAMLIGRIEKARFEYKLGYKTLCRVPVRQLTLIYGGRLGNLSSQNCEALVREIMKSLRQGEADVAFFNHVNTDSPLYQFATQMPGRLSRDHFLAPVLHWGMKLPSNVDELYSTIPADTRRQVRKHTKFLNADFAGRVRIERLDDVRNLDKFVCDIEDVAKKTYQRALGVGFVHTIERRQQLELEFRKGWLRAYVLYIADKPCAFWMGTLYQETFHSADVGYDPSFKKYGIGTLLLMRILEDFCRENIKEMDFGLGDAEWKRRLGNYTWHDVPVYLFAPRLKAIGLNALRTPMMLMSQIGTKVLDKTGLIQRIKTRWRTHLRQRSNALVASR